MKFDETYTTGYVRSSSDTIADRPKALRQVDPAVIARKADMTKDLIRARIIERAHNGDINAAWALLGYW